MNLANSTRRKTRFSEAEIATRFKPGRGKTGGRVRGSLNGVVRAFIESLAESLEQSGADGKGKHGAIGYLVWLSRKHPALYVQLIGRLMPAKVEVDLFSETDAPVSYPTLEEVRERIRASGLPVPPAFPIVDFTRRDEMPAQQECKSEQAIEWHQQRESETAIEPDPTVDPWS